MEASSCKSASSLAVPTASFPEYLERNLIHVLVYSQLWDDFNQEKKERKLTLVAMLSEDFSDEFPAEEHSL